MTKRTNAGARSPVDSYEHKPAPEQGSNPERTSGAPSGPYIPTGMTPDELFELIADLPMLTPPVRANHQRPYDPAGNALKGGYIALALLIRLRQEAADQVERLLAFIDSTDGDTDLEPEEVEQNLASFDNCYAAQDDAERDDCELEDGRDDEASLGSVNPMISGNQTSWVVGSDQDLEDEHDGREPEDPEDDNDSGIGDLDGLMEQVPRLFEHCDVRVEV